MQNWLSLIPNNVRLTIYLIVGIATIALTTVSTYFTTIQVEVPLWIVGISGSVAYLAGIFNIVAAGNVATGAVDAPDLDHDDYEVTDPETGETTTEIGKLGQ